MASISLQGKCFTVRFRFGNKNHRITAGSSRFEAERIREKIESLLADFKNGVVDSRFVLDQLNTSNGQDERGIESCLMSQQKKLRNALDDWMESKKRAETTELQYRRHADRLVNFFGDVELSQLDIQSYVDHRSQFVTAKTIKKELITLSSVLKWSYQSGIDFKRLRLPVNPAATPFTSLENAVDGRRVIMSREEVEELCETVRKNGSEMIADAVVFVAYTAARRSEVCRLHRRDIDLERGVVTLTELKRKHGHVTYRSIPIHKTLLHVLEKRKELDPVFTSSVDSLSSGLKEATKGTKFDIKGFGYHVLRHSAATQLINSGNSIPVVSKLLGHANVATTLNIYSHAIDRDLESVVAKL